jgi:hypothetical protein
MKEIKEIFEEKIICPECKGSGVVGNPVWEEYYKKHPGAYKLLWDEEDKLLKEFWGDKYDGKSVSVPEEIDCHMCGAMGTRRRTPEELIAELEQREFAVLENLTTEFKKMKVMIMPNCPFHPDYNLAISDVVERIWDIIKTRSGK